MICPNCTTEQPEWADICADCGAEIAFLRDHPRRVSAAIWACMLGGLALLIALFADVLDQLLAYRLPVLGWRQGVELAAGVVLSLLGARAWGVLRDTVLYRLARAR